MNVPSGTRCRAWRAAAAAPAGLPPGVPTFSSGVSRVTSMCIVAGAAVGEPDCTSMSMVAVPVAPEVEVVHHGRRLRRAVDLHRPRVRRPAARDVDDQRRLLRHAGLRLHHPCHGGAERDAERLAAGVEAWADLEVAAALLHERGVEVAPDARGAPEPDQQLLGAALEREVAQPVRRDEHAHLGEVEPGPVVADPCLVAQRRRCEVAVEVERRAAEADADRPVLFTADVGVRRFHRDELRHLDAARVVEARHAGSDERQHELGRRWRCHGASGSAAVAA